MWGIHSRPHLRALFRYDGEAYLFFAELDPCERAEGVERRGELYAWLVRIESRVIQHTRERCDVLYRCFEAHCRRCQNARGVEGLSRRVASRSVHDVILYITFLSEYLRTRQKIINTS